MSLKADPISSIDGNLSYPSDILGVATSSGGQSALSPEQLLDYIKKQKQKIKSLETKLAKSQGNSATDGSISASSSKINSKSNVLFWEFLSKESSFHQQLAKRAIGSMIYVLENSTLGRASIPTSKNLFDRWKNAIIAAKSQALEQRNSKLKVLLAKTHAISQKNAEDSNALKNLKERDENERLVGIYLIVF